ncbi:hypothetical protein C0J52_27447 [Blattella germanica]|nr:hypothetical protein C0J52_27447 [Blattella germanica]
MVNVLDPFIVDRITDVTPQKKSNGFRSELLAGYGMGLFLPILRSENRLSITSRTLFVKRHGAPSCCFLSARRHLPKGNIQCVHVSHVGYSCLNTRCTVIIDLCSANHKTHADFSANVNIKKQH